jgi:hypothetical protein
MGTSRGPLTRVRWLFAAVGVALFGAALGAPAASAVWTAPTTLNGANQAFNPQLAMTPDGDVVFAWELASEGGVQTRRITAGVLGAVAAVNSTTLAATPDVGVDADGNAVFGFQNFTAGPGASVNLASHTQLANGTFLASERGISPTSTTPDKPQLAVDPDGNTWFTWTGDNIDSARVQARRLTALNGPLSATRFLSVSGQDAVSPQVAVDPDGNAIFTWTRFDGANWRVQARRLSSANALGPVVDLSLAGQDAFDPQVGIDVDGDAVITWYRSDGTNFRAQARTLSSIGALGSVLDLSAAGRNANSPQVAVAPDGAALFTWRRFDGTNWRVQRVRMTSAGVLGAVLDVSAAGQDAAQPQVAINSSGNGILIWRRFDGTKQRIEARTVGASGGLGATAQISTAGVNSVTPQVAIAPSGATAAVWRAGTNVQEATGP